jgi:hypothetical protein
MNSVDPLAALKDIHLPEAISVWPPALAWWLVCAALLLTLALGLYYGLKNYRKQAYRRAALKALVQLEQDTMQPGYSLLKDRSLESSLVHLLKRTALSAYPRSDVARLIGHEWLIFMDNKASMNAFNTELGRRLLDNRFAPQPQRLDAATASQLLQITKQWIKKHS